MATALKQFRIEMQHHYEDMLLRMMMPWAWTLNKTWTASEEHLRRLPEPQQCIERARNDLTFRCLSDGAMLRAGPCEASLLHDCWAQSGLIVCEGVLPKLARFSSPSVAAAFAALTLQNEDYYAALLVTIAC